MVSECDCDEYADRQNENSDDMAMEKEKTNEAD